MAIHNKMAKFLYIGMTGIKWWWVWHAGSRGVQLVSVNRKTEFRWFVIYRNSKWRRWKRDIHISSMKTDKYRTISHLLNSVDRAGCFSQFRLKIAMEFMLNHSAKYSHSWEFCVPVVHISHLYIVIFIFCYHSERELSLGFNHFPFASSAKKFCAAISG